MRIHMHFLLGAILAGCGQSGPDSGTSEQTATEGDRGGPGAVPERTSEGAETAFNAVRDRIAETGADEPLSSARDYILRIAQENLYLIEASRIAAKDNVPQAMKTFAQELEAAHMRALEDLREASQVKDAASLIPETVNYDQAQQLDTLRTAKGSRLQQLYRRFQEAALEDLVQRHAEYEKFGRTPSLVGYAARYRTIETEYLKRVRDVSMRAPVADEGEQTHNSKFFPKRERAAIWLQSKSFVSRAS